MALGRETLDVHRLAIGYVAWVYENADGLTGSQRSAKCPWLRARLSGSGGSDPCGATPIDADPDFDSDSDWDETNPDKAVEATGYRASPLT
ncbi:MAG TPA: hypothetical protein PLZ60_14440 [Kiritimatiellia bacterium]|nr:hypothetical protein [Kiritimatiellia bacterium]HRR34480.1 hypothetical protein [Kiritimatiellia bacterium]HRU70738.1 hypothetical protein [Kiritimatiellia bacterium]